MAVFPGRLDCFSDEAARGGNTMEKGTPLARSEFLVRLFLALMIAPVA